MRKKNQDSKKKKKRKTAKQIYKYARTKKAQREAGFLF